jgi:hypothetical protein
MSDSTSTPAPSFGPLSPPSVGLLGRRPLGFNYPSEPSSTPNNVPASPTRPTLGPQMAFKRGVEQIRTTTEIKDTNESTYGNRTTGTSIGRGGARVPTNNRIVNKNHRNMKYSSTM